MSNVVREHCYHPPLALTPRHASLEDVVDQHRVPPDLKQAVRVDLHEKILALPQLRREISGVCSACVVETKRE